MKRSVLYPALAALILVGLALGLGYWFGMQRSHTAAATQGASNAPSPASRAAGGETSEPNTDRKVLYWHDPMVPGPKFDKPGKSPFMDMQLVPMYADEAADQGKVTINPRTAQNLGVRIAEVREGRLDMDFSVVGAVTVDERSITTVQSRVDGYVEKLYVRAQYDAVSRGQRLADIYAPEWLSAEEEYLTLRQSSQPGAGMLAEAARERLKLLGISEDQILAIERDGKANPRVTLYAPQNGIVWELGTRDGMAVTPGMTLFKLASLGSVWVNAEVPETQAELAKPGGAVEARVAAVPGKVFKGRVAALLPDVNPTTRTIKARVVLANPGGELKPGMFATLTLDSGEKPAMLVPAEAVIATGTRNVVIVAAGEGKFRPADVQPGRESGDMIEIRSGIAAGEKVVVSGQFLIDSEASLKATLGRMNEPENEQASTARPPQAKAATPKAHRAQGKIVAIEGDSITIQHGPVPSLQWGPMTMAFKAPSRILPRHLEVGDDIAFEFVQDQSGDFELTFVAHAAPAPGSSGTGRAGEGSKP
jgi:membrane fusion protein, copper/silver efflux system